MRSAHANRGRCPSLRRSPRHGEISPQKYIRGPPRDQYTASSEVSKPTSWQQHRSESRRPPGTARSILSCTSDRGQTRSATKGGDPHGSQPYGRSHCNKIVGQSITIVGESATIDGQSGMIVGQSRTLRRTINNNRRTIRILSNNRWTIRNNRRTIKNTRRTIKTIVGQSEFSHR